MKHLPQPRSGPPDLPTSRAGHCPTCGADVQVLNSSESTAHRQVPVLLAATGIVALCPPDPLAEVAQWHVRLTYPLHPPMCGLGTLPGGRLPR